MLVLFRPVDDNRKKVVIADLIKAIKQVTDTVGSLEHSVQTISSLITEASVLGHGLQWLTFGQPMCNVFQDANTELATLVTAYVATESVQKTLTEEDTTTFMLAVLGKVNDHNHANQS